MVNESDALDQVATAAGNDSADKTDENHEISTVSAPATEENPLAYRKRKKRLGDRRDGRKLRTVALMTRIMPYVMPKRCDALNTFFDRIEVSKADELCRRKVREGKQNFTILHVFLAAYLRTISQKPGINRFVSGQKIYARNEISFNMVVKKDMALNSPDTCIKVKFNPGDTLDEVYEKFNTVAQEAIDKLGGDPTSFERFVGNMKYVPGFLIRWLFELIRVLDYIGLLPMSIENISPFHGSMIITSMGSLGINPIYHHIYNLGNLPVFLSYGTKKTVYEYDRKGELKRRRYIDLKAVTDERICDGYYYAAAFKYFKKLMENPAVLETRPEAVLEDID